ncbi:magnesium transporter CorA family protein [Saccharomonospora sp. NPDC046836]|uniref:magnesium transporter CorA family protein n=1 Tax=Saccharomonospora sp. NPDC046836 TaxID=3156921 RepID=UPI0033F23718
MARTRVYRSGVLDAEDVSLAQLPEHLRDPAATVWIDVCGPDEQELGTLGEELGLHQLAVDNAVAGEHQRPALNHFGDHWFLTSYSARLQDGKLVECQLDAFITDRVLVTIRRDARFDIAAVVERWDDNADLAKEGVGFLLYGLLDYLVDGYLGAAQELDDEIGSLEDLVFAARKDPATLQRRALRVRRSLMGMRHTVIPMREVVNSLLRRDSRPLSPALLPYFQDVYDHMLRVSEWTESLRELLATVRETQLSIQANRMSLIMKKVTSWAAIIAVPTAITGFYGQNLPYPGFGQLWGFWVSTGVMLALSAALYVLFKRRDWL